MLGGLLTTPLAAGAHAAEWPSKPVQWVVPRGSVVYIEQVESGIVVMFASARLTYSDVHVNEKTGELVELRTANSTTNWRFFLKAHLRPGSNTNAGSIPRWPAMCKPSWFRPNCAHASSWAAASASPRRMFPAVAFGQ